MNILGISDMINAGAAVLADGEVVAAVQEERLNRMKLTIGYPRNAIAKALEIAGVSAPEIDAVAVAQLHGYFYPEARPCPGWLELRPGGLRSQLMALGDTLSPLVGRFSVSRTAYHAAKSFATRHRPARIREALERDFGLRAPIQYFEHHYVHACTAYWASDFDDALVVTMDGGGDSHSSQVYSARGGELEQLHAVDSHDSIGNYYSYITNLCGFKTHRHEGKITGLAAAGTPRYLDTLRRFIRYENGTMRNVANLAFRGAVARLREALPPNFEMADAAASIQALLEEIATQYVVYWLRKTGHRRVAVAGGVFANVKLNQRILQLDEIDQLFVYPAMDDGGLPVGAAQARWHRHAPYRRGGSRLHDVYWGPGFSEGEMRAAIRASGLEHETCANIHLEHEACANIHEEIARLLAQGHVVCRFRGRMEFGPRALGNRSILFQTTDRSVNDWLNVALHRTEFMPFAPATLGEFADECYLDYRKAESCARFMTVTFDCTPRMKRESPGVVHLDGTARPQVVDPETAPDFYGILQAYHALTGIPSLINTSFNIHEEPIVCTPQEAIQSLEDSGLPYLAMGDTIVKGSGRAAWEERAAREAARG